MIVFFISTWSAESGLSHASVHPHLAQLATDPRVDKVCYFSVETALQTDYAPASHKILHFPWVSTGHMHPLLEKAALQIGLTRLLWRMARKLNPRFVVCRGAPAGIFGLRIRRRFGTPFYVESFEPHASYMAESGAWSRFGLQYFLQRRWEERIKTSAAAVMTVSHGYARHLIKNEGVEPTRVVTVPCWVDQQVFRFDSSARQELRRRFGADEALVVVYTGKFGGLYYGEEAFRVLRELRVVAGVRVFLLVLTPEPHEPILAQLRKAGFNETDCFVDAVPHKDVADYLSTADIAISFHRSTRWSYAFSPIKHGEFWACGLPVIMPPGVGDEAGWVAAERAGAIADMNAPESIEDALQTVLRIISEPGHRERIREVAARRRPKADLERAYQSLISFHSRDDDVTHESEEPA